jgi:hypothetical protein
MHGQLWQPRPSGGIKCDLDGLKTLKVSLPRRLACAVHHVARCIAYFRDLFEQLRNELRRKRGAHLSYGNVQAVEISLDAFALRDHHQRLHELRVVVENLTVVHRASGYGNGLNLLDNNLLKDWTGGLGERVNGFTYETAPCGRILVQSEDGDFAVHAGDLRWVGSCAEDAQLRSEAGALRLERQPMPQSRVGRWRTSSAQPRNPDDNRMIEASGRCEASPALALRRNTLAAPGP